MLSHLGQYLLTYQTNGEERELDLQFLVHHHTITVTRIIIHVTITIINHHLDTDTIDRMITVASRLIDTDTTSLLIIIIDPTLDTDMIPLGIMMIILYLMTVIDQEHLHGIDTTVHHLTVLIIDLLPIIIPTRFMLILTVNFVASSAISPMVVFHLQSVHIKR